MDHNICGKLYKYYRSNKRKRLRNRILTVLGSIVVFITTYMLILPAITVEQTPLCGIEEHQHSENCYGQVPVVIKKPQLICTQEVHIHTDACIDKDENVICGYEDFIVHTHSDLCYSGEELICSLPVISEHKHTDECYRTDKLLICDLAESYHLHSSECYGDLSAECGYDETDGHLHTGSCYPAESEPLCGTAEDISGHRHIEECYREVQTLICGLREAILHSHGKDCYREMCTHPDCNCEACAEGICTDDVICTCDICTGHACECELCQCEICTDETCECTACAENKGKTCKEEVLICTQPILTEHKHTDGCIEMTETVGYEEGLVCGKAEHSHDLACMSDPGADLENEESWISVFSGIRRTGKISRDILAIAKTQLGYTESKLNYAVAQDGVTTMGYTRYGQWYGLPYSDWNGLFAAFCAEYANTDVIPKEADVNKIVEHVKAESPQLYKQAEDYFPGGGDIAVTDINGDGIADRLGIVSETSSSEGWFRTIEGDVSGTVSVSTYNSQNALIIGYLQLTSSSIDYTVNSLSELNVAGTVMYHPPEHPEYQYSSHRVGGYMAINYLLVPYDAYIAGWTPNTLDWNAKAGANYVVTYCAAMNDRVSETGEKYTVVKITDSDVYKDVAPALSGIVEHAYPFITAEEMKAELSAAYKTGKIAVDLSCCSESEFIAAAQWAIWDMSGLSDPQSTVTESCFPESDTTLNPLTDLGHTEESLMQTHVKAIRDWLVTQRPVDKITVTGHSSEIIRRADGSYDAEVTVTLSRPLGEKEEINVLFAAGEKRYETVYAEKGGSSFEVSLCGLSDSELLAAEVKLTVLSDHIQVFVYDSESRQDMISGQWGVDQYDLSFELDVETTDVKVEKIWSDGVSGAELVTVQLYADGKKHGEPVILSENNGWKYSWNELVKYSSDNVLIDYTVAETPVPGYLSSVEKANGGQKTVFTASQVSSMKEGEQYLITYENANALSIKEADGSFFLDWVRDLNTAELGDIPPEAVFTALSVSEDGSYAYLYNERTDRYLYFDGNRITVSASQKTMAYYLYDHFYFLDNTSNRYLSYLDGGEGYVTDSWDDTLKVSFYRITETVTEASGVKYTITNTKAEESTSVQVLKEWRGKDYGDYPASVTVTLHQNGAPYGMPVVLNAENGWSFTWEELPVSLNGTEYKYTVEESAVTGYSTKITGATEEDGTVKYLIVNTWDYEKIPFKVLKTDGHDTSILLSGASFSLYRIDPEGDTTIPYTDALIGTLLLSVTTGDDGYAILGELEIGHTYYLIETKAPSRYNKLTEPIIFVTERDISGRPTASIVSAPSLVTMSDDSDDTAVINVKNRPGYHLPETGGAGNYRYTIGGALIMLMSAALLLYKTKQHERRKE